MDWEPLSLTSGEHWESPRPRDSVLPGTGADRWQRRQGWSPAHLCPLPSISSPRRGAGARVSAHFCLRCPPSLGKPHCVDASLTCTAPFPAAAPTPGRWRCGAGCRPAQAAASTKVKGRDAEGGGEEPAPGVTPRTGGVRATLQHAGPTDLGLHSDIASLQTKGGHVTCFDLLIIFVLNAYISLL